MRSNQWYRIENLDTLDTPALVVYPERVRQNIAHLLAMVPDAARLRPHVKTQKSSEATKLLLNAGITQFKCATIAEAEMLADVGAVDVLLAYQPVGPKQDRLLTLIQTYSHTTFSCLADNLNTAQTLSERAEAAGVTVGVFVDLNVGMNRTGRLPDTSVLGFYEQLAALPGIRPMGLHAYDGHIRDTDLAARIAHADEAFAPVAALRDALREKGVAPIIVVGGSPTFPVHARRPDVQCSPGTFIYWDKGYASALPDQPFEPAALVVGRVISTPTPTTICVDIGHKAVAAENDLTKRITFLNAPNLTPIGQSEEHLVLDAGDGHTWQIGDVLYGLPQHICPTVALYERAVTVENGYCSGFWQTTARARTLHV